MGGRPHVFLGQLCLRCFSRAPKCGLFWPTRAPKLETQDASGGHRASHIHALRCLHSHFTNSTMGTHFSKRAPSAACIRRIEYRIRTPTKCYCSHKVNTNYFSRQSSAISHGYIDARPSKLGLLLVYVRVLRSNFKALLSRRY